MKKRIFSMLLAATLCVGLLPTAAFAENEPPSGNWLDDGNYDTSWYVEHENETEYTLSTAAELAGLAYLCEKVSPYEEHFADKTIKLGGDIDLSAHYWTPFDFNKAVFDGCGHSVFGMNVQTVDGISNYGFFSDVNYAEIRSLSVYGEININTDDDVGGVAGEVDNVVMSSVFSYVNIVSGGNDTLYQVGGLVGNADAFTAKDCRYDGDIVATNNAEAGGLAGEMDNREGECSMLLNCMASGTLTVRCKSNSGGEIGGLVGELGDDALVLNSGSTMNIVLQEISPDSGVGAGEVGGIAGDVDGDSAVIMNCWFKGTLPGNLDRDSVSGIAADKNSGNTFEDCWSNFSTRIGGGYGGNAITNMEQLTIDLNAGAVRLKEQFPDVGMIRLWQISANNLPVLCDIDYDVEIIQQPTAVQPTFSVTNSEKAAFQWQLWSPVAYSSAAKTVTTDGTYLWNESENIYTSTNNVDLSRSTLTANYTVEDSGTIAFRWKVSSEEGFDVLFYTLTGPGNFNEMYAISGEEAWSDVKFTDLAAGDYTLTFTYTKDSSGLDGSDCGYVDLSPQQVYTWADIPGEADSSLSAVGYADNRGKVLRCVATYPLAVLLGSDSFQPSDDICAIGFDSDGGSAVDAMFAAKSGEIKLPSAPSRNGYVFQGWMGADEQLRTAGESFTATGDTVFTAVWTAYNPGSSATPSYDDSDPTYSITLPKQTPGGRVTSQPRYAEEGDRVTITATPDEGYELDSLTVTDSRDNPIELTDRGEGKYTFTMPGRNVTVAAKFSKIEETPAPWRNPFTDVSEGDWYYEAVQYAYQNGLMAGTSATTFSPDVTTSRAMIATILWRQVGSPVVNYAMNFDDVDASAWYGEAVRWAASEGIVSGYGNGKFGSNDPITREQLAAMLYNYEKKQGGGFTGAWAFRLDYEDAGQVSEWAYEPMCWMVMNGVISGTSTATLTPQGQATRAQTAVMLMRYFEATEE